MSGVPAGSAFNQHLGLQALCWRRIVDAPNSTLRVQGLDSPLPPVSKNLLKGTHNPELFLDIIRQVPDKDDVVRQKRVGEADAGAARAETAPLPPRDAGLIQPLNLDYATVIETGGQKIEFAPFSKDASAVPEPATLLLLGGGLVGLAGFGRKKFKK